MGALTLGDWAVEEWIGMPRSAGSDDPAGLAGRVVLAAAFQMLCPGCVEQTIPQLRRAAATFPPEDVAVVGLHSVFEHHDAMTPVALRAFLHEYRVTFPVAVDSPGADGGPVPTTMARFAMRGTPTVMLYDRSGVLRRQTFGHVPDLQLGAEVAALIHEDRPPARDVEAPALVSPGAGGSCADGVCEH